MLSRCLVGYLLLTACWQASLALGHGTPIVIDATAGALSVAHPEDGYAPYVFGQSVEGSDPAGPFNHPVLGSTLLWDLPGIEINGMAGTASLALEVLSPDAPNGTPQELWRWDPATRDIGPTPANAELRLLLADGGLVSLRGTGETPAPVVLATSVAGETGFHNHGLLNFAMPYEAALTAGLYGFFARLTSNEYEPSEPFLTIFNVGVSYDDLVPASDALWGAALPGDYDHDGRVDDADRAEWASAYGGEPSVRWAGADGNGDGLINASDYTIWRDNREATLMSLSPGAVVPEPRAGLLGLFGVAGLVARYRR